MKKHLSKIIFALIVVAFTIACAINAPIGEAVGSLWSLLPPVVAIGLALITKEVYSSLFIGILAGGAIYATSSSSGFEGMFTAVISDGLIANLSDSYNVGILIFLVVLGIIVVLMNKAGGSRAYGEWAATHIKSKVGANLATFALGALIFVDDYFNCLTVGSVMRPVTDKHKISRSKLAYLIDATAAPVCIIAPISSWAAAVSGTVEGVNGIQLFISTIPYNLYALLTLLMVVYVSCTGLDFGPMKKHEENAAKGDLFTTRNKVYDEDDKPSHTKGKVLDLVL
ncbi:MAG: Na+/H+ antiporter NhaC family protein, partial [Ruminococcus sp.]|nr:Na+/H+ antiporter NhaC family protein [Ruminococcus sp.]